MLNHFRPAIVLFVLSNCLGAGQWFLLLRAQGLPVSPRKALVFYFVGIFFNNVLLGNIGGDAMRIFDIRRLTGRSSAAVAATMMDRFVGLASTCTLALLAYPVIARVEVAWLISVLAPVWLGLLALLVMGLSRSLGRLLEAVIGRILPRLVAAPISELRRSVVLYRDRVPLLGGVFFLSLTVQFSRILVYYAAGRAVGMDPGLIYFVCFQPVAAIIAALPISVGGLGVREGTLIGLFTGLGIARNVTLAMSLLGYVSGLIASLLGGVAFVLRRVESRDVPKQA